jgi:phytoene dehydrogenase-like protein
MTRRRRIAVIRSGVAGPTTAHDAARTAQVTLYEAEPRLGGHADTHAVHGLALDTGFNQRTYPALLRLFAELASRRSRRSCRCRCPTRSRNWSTPEDSQRRILLQVLSPMEITSQEMRRPQQGVLTSACPHLE